MTSSILKRSRQAIFQRRKSELITLLSIIISITTLSGWISVVEISKVASQGLAQDSSVDHAHDAQTTDAQKLITATLAHQQASLTVNTATSVNNHFATDIHALANVH